VTDHGSAVIRFAHRGAPTGGLRGNTLEAFVAALGAGASGLESDVQLTADGVPVLAHGLPFAGRRPIRSLMRAELPPSIPSLADLYERCGADFDLALDMSAPRAARAVVALARRHGASDRLWLTYWRLPAMAAWRRAWPETHLVYATMFAVPAPMLRRTCAQACAAGVDTLNLHHRLLTRSTAATAGAAGLRLFAWGVSQPRDELRARSLGVDGVFVDRIAPVELGVR
jgi:glycerophosphoryl diester phosphodiesterase